MEKGGENKALQMAQAMLQKGMEISMIAEIAELSVETIKSLRKNIKK